MEIMLLDFSFFVISLILASLILAFYSLSPKWSNSNSENGEDLAVIEIIRTLKKACPVQFSNEWKLLPQNLSAFRSWSKNVSFLSLKNSINLYGATCAMTCSSTYAFSLISDVTKWGEWEPSQSAQHLRLQPCSNNDLKKDHFMQVNEIASLLKGYDGSSSVAMYRFSSFPSKCTKWILFWNAKKFEFMFFLLQPATSRAVNIECTVTHIYGSDTFSPDFPTLVSERLRNIKEFLFFSQLNIRPLSYSVPSPVPHLLSPEKELNHSVDSPTITLETDSSDASNSVFVLVPLFQCLCLALKRLKGFDLKLKELGIKSQQETSKRKINLKKQSSSPEFSTAANEKTSIGAGKTQWFDDENLNSKNVKQIISENNDSMPCDIENEIDKISVASEADETINIQTLNSEKSSDSQTLVPSIKSHNSSESIESVNKSLSASQLPDLVEEENQNYVPFKGDESGKAWDRSELFCSSASDFEILDNVNQQFKDTTMAGYLTQGNYGASVLQTEMMLASQFDRTLHLGNRVAGGWIHLSTHKGIPVLTKSIEGKIMKILSFLCQIEIPVNYKDVWKCVKNPRFRFILDETVKTVEIIDRISDFQKLIHVYHETSGIIRKESTDFCLLQTEREEPNSFYSVFQSFEYEKCPLMSSVTRGCLKPSGWIVQNLTPKSCKVTHLIQIFVNSSDNMLIQELNSLVPQSLHNLKQYITSRPK